MRVLINNTVKTDTSDYTFNTREEAEAFFMTLKSADRHRDKAAATPQVQAAPRKGGGKGGKGATRH
jgi:hypothetical protein